MKTLRELTKEKIESGRKAKPEFMARVDEIILEQQNASEGKNALKVGEQAPLFNLPSAIDEEVSLGSLLKKGPVVVTFYRGSWCPYCNLQLRSLQSQVSAIKELGANLIAISPQAPDGSMNDEEIRNMEFIVLSDQDCEVARQFGVAWKVPDFLLEHMKVDRGLDLGKLNKNNGDILPIPATFILDSSGKVVWSFVDVDYRKRSEPSEIIDFLKAKKDL